jgi:hypothetical protein
VLGFSATTWHALLCAGRGASQSSQEYEPAKCSALLVVTTGVGGVGCCRRLPATQSAAGATTRIKFTVQSSVTMSSDEHWYWRGQSICWERIQQKMHCLKLRQVLFNGGASHGPRVSTGARGLARAR